MRMLISATVVLAALSNAAAYPQTIIRIVTKDGVIQDFDAKGHSGYAEAGHDIVCAVISSTLRTFGKIMSGTKYFEGGGAPEPGSMWIKLGEIKDVSDRRWAQGISDFVLRTLRDLESEYPRFVKLTINDM